MHENLVEMFRDRPDFAADLLAGTLGITVPPFEKARVSPGDLNDIMPTEFRADLVVSLTRGDKVVLAVIVEAQLRTDARKRRSWPAYVGTLYARLGCPVVLLVVCPNRKAARWCAMPIAFGIPNLVLTPLVLGPHQVPAVLDIAAARRVPELAILSVLTYGDRSPDQRLIFEAFLSVLSAFDDDHAERYTEVILATLQATARAHLEELMSTASAEFPTPFLDRWREKYKTKLEAMAKAQAEAEVAAQVKADVAVRAAQVAQQVAQQVAAQVEQQIATQVEQQVAAYREQQIAQVEQQVAAYKEQQVAAQVEQQVAAQLEQQVAAQVEQQVAAQVAEATAQAKIEAMAAVKTEMKMAAKAEAALTVLSARGVAPTDRERERILSCTDSDQLDLWLRRAATVATTEELFS